MWVYEEKQVVQEVSVRLKMAVAGDYIAAVVRVAVKVAAAAY